MQQVTDQTGGFSMNSAEIAALLEARLTGEARQVQGVSTDTRRLVAGQLFVALRGANFDAHDFVVQAQQRGAACCLVQQAVAGVNCLVVPDTRLALGKLARAWRERFSLPVVAVTGSNGKTTVKEMLAAILRRQGKVLATRGNLNNDIGLPLTLFELDQSHDFAVLELGANHPGEIAYLTAIARPQVAIITNAGAAHLEGFGSIQGVAQAKGEIYSGLQAAGTAIINNDDRFASYWKSLNSERRMLSFGLGGGADVQALTQADDPMQVGITTPRAEFTLRLSLPGRHNLLNALAAIAACTALDIPAKAMREGLETLKPVPGRLQLRQGLNGSRIIDDTYNANPTSLHAALEVLQGFPGRHFLVLGDMGELGADSAGLHAAAGQQARDMDVDRLYAYGQQARHAGEAFGEGAQLFADQQQLIEQLATELAEDVNVLIKGSRSMRMENVVAGLTVEAKS